MDKQDHGFLNDTSLSKTPKSPLKTSTVLRPNLRRGSKQNASVHGIDTSYDPLEGSSHPALNEVTNIQNFPILKMKFNESSFADDRNSSLGILELENFSDFTDTSLRNSTVNTKMKVKTKKLRKSKVSHLNADKALSSVSKNKFPPNVTVLSAQDVAEYHNGESSSSSDIEYDGTNIPELNLDYDPISSRRATDTAVSKSKFNREVSAKERTQSLIGNTTNNEKQSKLFDFTNNSSQSSNAEPGSLAKDSACARDSIFEAFDPAYDSILRTLMPTGGVSELDSKKMSEMMKGPPFINFNSTEMESVLQNQSLAELHFMRNIEKLGFSGQHSPIKFCTDEISARSSSFRSSAASSNASRTFASNSDSQNQSENVLSAEGLKDEVPRSSLFPESSLEKSESYNFTSSFKDENLVANSSKCVSKASSFLKSENDATSNTSAEVTNQNFENFQYSSDLIFKDMSVFASGDANEQSQFGVSDSDFFSPGKAMEIFKKDEEILNQERRFEIGNDTKGSVFSNSSPPAQNGIPAPSWFLAMNNGDSQNPERHISIGTLISARTECLGRLSQDSQRERPFFGTAVTTPVKDFPESSFMLSESLESNFQNASDEEFTMVASGHGSSTTVCETPKSHFGIGVRGYNESALKDLLQNYSQNNESELIRGSALSQLLNELSTDQPLALAARILEKCRPFNGHLAINQSVDTNTIPPLTGSRNSTETSPNTTLKSDKLNSTLTRSSSEDSLGDTLTKTPNKQDKNLLLTIHNVKMNDEKTQAISNTRGCPCCQQQKGQHTCLRPQSSCSSLCSNPMPIQNALQAQYGCMKYFASSQEHCHQIAGSSCGSAPQSDNGLHGCQNHNPYLQDMLRTQMVGQQLGFQQTPIQTGCAQFPFPVQGSIYSYPTLQGPNELVYPQKLSVGDSQSMSLTVQNIHNMQFYHVSFVSAFVNEESVPLEIAGLSFPGMVPRSSGSNTDIQITLSPKYEGNVTVTLQIVASFNPANVTLAALSTLPLQTKIKYESLRPCISISSKNQRNLDLGKVIAGSTVLEHITISNKCDATVPLHLSLSNDSHDNHITFGLSHLKCPAVAQWKMLSPKEIRYRLPCSKDASVMAHLEVPIVFEAGNQDADVNFTLTAAVESFSVRETLGSFRISASVRNAKLVLVDPKQNRLLLSARTGSSCSKMLNVKNDGSFPVVYDLEVIDNTQSFSALPSSLKLQPMQSSTIAISFSPTSNENVEGILQATSQPHGKIFRVAELFGDVKRAPREKISLKNSTNNVVPERVPREARVNPGCNVIECNKKYLCWGGVDVGNTVSKVLTIRNSSNKSLKTKLFIKEKSNNFKLLDESNEQSVCLTLGLNAKEQRTVSIAFTPTKIEPSSGFLVIKPLLEKDVKIFSMPLSGYGGTGKLKVTQVSEKEGIGSCLDIVLPVERRPVFSSVIVHNTGFRPIFVKVLFSSASANASEAHVSISPEEFVLCEKENKTLYISYTSEDSFGFHASDCGVITLLYGDEVLRQQMRRSKNERSSQNDVNRNINFDVHYVGEEKVPYDHLYQCITKISSIFSLSVRRYLIHLNVVEQNASCSQMTFDALSVIGDAFPDFTTNSMMYSRRLTTASNLCHSPPVKDFAVDMLSRFSMPHQLSYLDELSHSDLHNAGDNSMIKDPAADSWTVKPETLVIDSGNKDNRVLLSNLTKQDLKFKIESAIDVISVSPVSGVIPARGEIGLRITIIPYNYSKLCEDYKGYIKVICGGSEKSVVVNVLGDQRRASSIAESSMDVGEQLQSISDESILDRADNTIICPASVFIKDICDFPKEINLNTTVPEKVSETLLTVQNSDKVSARWDIRPISMLFTESLDDSLIPTQILQIKPDSGTLKFMEVSNIVIKFMPSRPASFSQFFEFSIVFENGSEQKCNFKVFGKASLCLTESTEINKPSSNAECAQKLSKESIYIENETCDFPDTPLGQSSTVYAVLKNASLSDVKLNVIKPHLPFIVIQSAVLIRSKRFLKIPISFKPTKGPKNYEDILVLHSEDGHQFMFMLKATCNGMKK